VNNVEIEAGLPTIVPDALCFETGASRTEAADGSLFVYEHHGEDFGWADPGALTCLFEDLIHGREMPPKFVSRALRDIDVLVAIALHQEPKVTVLPNALKLVTSVDLVHRRGAVGMAHVEEDLADFFRFLRKLFPKDLPKSQFDKQLTLAVTLILEHITNNQLPASQRLNPQTVVIDVGSRGFVLAESRGTLGEAWVHLFRNGFLRGVVVSPDHQGRRHVLGSRKGPYVRFELATAARLLNDMERVMGELADWSSDGLWLYGPPDGTVIRVTHLLDVLVRV
jgi:hypothetical protein